jgi:hypothetical protein
MKSPRSNELSDVGDWDPFALRIKAKYEGRPGTYKAEYGEVLLSRGWAAHFPEGRTRRAYDADPIRCSNATQERALKIINAICLEVRKAGFAIGMGYSCSCIELLRDEIRISVRLVELSSRVPKQLPEHKDHLLGGQYGLVGTGWLEFRINDGCAPSAKFKERSGIDLVAHAPTILAEIERIHAIRLAEENERKRKLAELARARAEREEAQRRVDEERALERRRIDEEQARRDQLIRDASTWNVAQQILRYVDAMERKMTAEEGAVDGVEQWKSWALRVVQEMIEESAAAVRARVSDAPDD